MNTKIILGFILTLPFIFGLNTEAFLNEDIYSEDKQIIGCINKYTLDYVAFEKATTNPTACFIGKGYEEVVYNSNEYWHLKIDLEFNETDILDLLTIRTLECKDPNGYCHGGGVDYGPFQINNIHKEDYNESLKLEGLELFEFQAKWTYLNKLNGYNYYKWCTPYTSTREGLSKCRFKLHNGNNKSVGGRKYKEIYADAGWVIREHILKPYIKNNEYIGQQ